MVFRSLQFRVYEEKDGLDLGFEIAIILMVRRSSFVARATG